MCTFFLEKFESGTLETSKTNWCQPLSDIYNWVSHTKYTCPISKYTAVPNTKYTIPNSPSQIDHDKGMFGFGPRPELVSPTGIYLGLSHLYTNTISKYTLSQIQNTPFQIRFDKGVFGFEPGPVAATQIYLDGSVSSLATWPTPHTTSPLIINRF